MHAQLYKLEQEAAMKKAAGVPLAKPRRASGPQLGKANAGVAERAERDRLQAPTEANRLAESEVALQRKAALYDRLSRGEGTEAEEVSGLASYNAPALCACASTVGSNCHTPVCAIPTTGYVPCGLPWQVGISATER